jgi:hypothetical protein
VAVVTLLAVVVWASWPVVAGSIIGQDATTFFYVSYSFLGDRLRAGHLPGWNPYQFAGTPFAGDPESGWTYLPAMAAFTALPFAVAIKAYLLFLLLATAVAAYLLARALGYVTIGALAAGSAFSLSTFAVEHSACCPIYGQIDTWVPALLLGTVIAVRARTGLRRLFGWGLAGVAWSQIMAAWLGQGTYFAALLWSAFLLYLGICRFAEGRSLVAVLRTIAGNAAAIAGLGALLGMAGILPRLEANALSTIPGGRYEGALGGFAGAGGWRWEEAVPNLFNAHSGWYPGVVVLVLAVPALILARGRLGAPYFALVGGAAFVLAFRHETPLHSALNLLPLFERLSQHQPQRVLVFVYFGLAFLAGATISELWRRRPGWPVTVVLAATVVGTYVGIRQLQDRHPGDVADWTVHHAWLAAVWLGAILLTGRFRLLAGRLLLPALIALILIDNLHVAHALMVPRGSFYRVDLADYYAPPGAARFLREQDAADPARFFGYSPQVMARWTSYRFFFGDPRQFGIEPVQPLVVNNLATLYGLQDAQGYNPQQMRRYVDVVNALNGRLQEYHETNILPAGLGSPLLAALGVRYVVLPAQVSRDDPHLAPLANAPVVYRDADVQIVALESAFPRAWLVHDAVQRDPDQVRADLANGTHDLRRTALVEEAPPELAAPADPARDRVSFEAYAPEAVRLKVETQAPAMLVLSDVYYPAWHAYVDGRPVKVYATDGAFRGVAVPAGTHTVEFRYEDRWLTAGTVVSGSAALLLLGAIVAGIARTFRGTRRSQAPSASPPSVPYGDSSMPLP